MKLVTIRELVENNMTHYVCTGGCGGVSETPGACQDGSCVLHGHPLTECNCTDGQHKEAFEKTDKSQ